MNKEKVATVVGGAAAMALAGALLGTPTGWLALGTAALAGSRDASNLLRVKAKLWQASKDSGGYFRCRRCDRDIPLREVLF